MAKKEEKLTKKNKGAKCCMLNNKISKGLLILLFLLTLTSLIFFWLYPFVNDWLSRQETVIEDTKENIEVVIKSEESVVIEVVENSMDAVVSIAISRLEFSEVEGIVDSVSNIGSGFIVDPSGIIITNQHVVSEPGAEYKIITNDGQEYEVIKILNDEINAKCWRPNRFNC